jgi:hypothetical protein
MTDGQRVSIQGLMAYDKGGMPICLMRVDGMFCGVCDGLWIPYSNDGFTIGHEFWSTL